MANINAAFNAKNGIAVANTLLIDTANNLSNIATANITTLNVTNPIAQKANTGVFVNGTLVANNPNLNFVASNTSNISITGTSNTSPGNVTITFDLAIPAYNVTYLNTATINAAVAANGSGGLNVSFNVNTSAVGGSSGGANVASAYANGTIILANGNLNFNNTSTINVVASANGSNGSNISFTVNSNAVLGLISSGNTSNILITYSGGNPVLDTRLPPGGGGGSPGGANQQLQFNNTSTFGGTTNLTWNITSNLMSVEGNVMMANASQLAFGGGQANTIANAQFIISYNASTVSLDFQWI